MKSDMKNIKSESLFARAEAVIPGGVNSPVRAFGSVGIHPRFIKKGLGSHVFDEDGNEYIDFVSSWGALILGHAHPAVVDAAQKAAADGLTFGAATAQEVELAELICSAVPSIEKIRLVSSGTEATMTAIRLARAFTHRSKILKFEGCYHGHADPFLVKAGSGLLTFGNPSSAGVPESVIKETLIASYNGIDSIEKAFADYGKDLACVIVEPVAANMGLVLPKLGFLERLRTLCNQYNTLLIFDEVITGFRFCFGGYQLIIKIDPDLTTLGKIIGGGMPLAAVGGKREIMDLLAPIGPVYQAGTLSGNPVATAAGLATLKILKEENPYPELEKITADFGRSIQKIAEKIGVKVSVNRAGSLLSIFFNPGPVETFDAVMKSNAEAYKNLFRRMLDQGVYLPPSPFEAWFLSAAHSESDIQETIQKLESALSNLA